MTDADLDRLAETWLLALERELPAAEQLRRELHANPRRSGDEADTTARIAAATGIRFEPTAGTGGVARLGPAAGPSVLVRAELDALPVTERTGAACAAEGGLMHACGHDVHLAALTALLRAAEGLELPVGLLALLQPREETYPSGASDVCAEGVLERWQVAWAVGAHVHPQVPRGAVATGAGPVNAASSELEIRLSGGGGHGAYPHHARDVAAVASGLVLALPELVRRSVDPLAPALISVGTISVGEGGANVLPDRGVVRAMLRTMGPGDDERIVEAVRRFARGHAEGFGVEVEVAWEAGEPVLANDADLVERLERRLPGLGLAPSAPMRSLGADDFSFFAEAVPSIMCFVGVDSIGPDPDASLHDPTFLPDDGAVSRTARAMLAGYLASAVSLADGGAA
ncbi:M20 metallopeptidase family protein [Micrococcus luteus]|uniref:M20 metallopeptidase family protein n=1 Tax=Micrococcus luteus TaxID=1270 RepID=UPI00340E174F